jgi:hypothetical protein
MNWEEIKSKVIEELKDILKENNNSDLEQLKLKVFLSVIKNNTINLQNI